MRISDGSSDVCSSDLQALAIEEQDMSITWVFGGSLFLMLPIGALLWFELSGGPLAGASFALIAGAILFIIIVGLLIAPVKGFLVGLIRAPHSPLLGFCIPAILAPSLLLLRLLCLCGGAAQATRDEAS